MRNVLYRSTSSISSAGWRRCACLVTRNNVSPSPDACGVELMLYRRSVPPYGKETAPQMQTIYDFKHLKASAHFLNTQYRMPVPLGEFISEYVYDKKLLSVHPTTDFSAVLFVDVRKGQEERVGSSWKVYLLVESAARSGALSHVFAEHRGGARSCKHRQELL